MPNFKGRDSAVDPIPKKEGERFNFSEAEILEILRRREATEGHVYVTDEVLRFLRTAEDRDQQYFPNFTLHKVAGMFELKAPSGAKF